MDDTDRQILSELRRDGRISLSDLAVALDVTRATVRARIEKMTKTGEIQGFTVITRGDVTERPVRALMMLQAEGPGLDRIYRQVSGRPHVQAVHSTNGKWDLIVELGTDTLPELDKVLFDIRRLEGVTNSETSILLGTSRYGGVRRAAWP